MEWLNTGITSLKERIAFLHKKSRTNDVQEKQLIMELRNDLNVFKNGFLNEVTYDSMVDLMANEAIQSAVKKNFSFKKLKAGSIQAGDVQDERNKIYVGWIAERLTDKIDEEIVELRNITKMNGGSAEKVKTNISLMMSNLYFRMKLLADFIRSDNQMDETTGKNNNEIQKYLK